MASIREIMGWHEARDARRELWESARTIAHLGDLTAQWLDGVLPYNPAYGGPGEPDPETAEIRDVLAVLNRTGEIVTTGSQPGRPDRQRALVDMYATRNASRAILNAVDDVIATHHAIETGVPIDQRTTAPVAFVRWDAPGGHGRIPVACNGYGETTAHIGHVMSRRDIAQQFDRHLRPELVDELGELAQISVYANRWDDGAILWRTLVDALRDL